MRSGGQQGQPRSLFSSMILELILTGFPCCGWLALPLACAMREARRAKVSCTNSPVLELHSMYLTPIRTARPSASQREMLRSWAASVLVPTSRRTQSGAACSSICASHFSTLAKEGLSVREKARRMPVAPRQQACVMFLKRSCPAVSQICILSILSPTGTTRDLKSTPIVAVQDTTNRSSVKRVISAVLPTPPSPITSTFANMSCPLPVAPTSPPGVSRSSLPLIIHYTPHELLCKTYQIHHAQASSRATSRSSRKRQPRRRSWRQRSLEHRSWSARDSMCAVRSIAIPIVMVVPYLAFPQRTRLCPQLGTNSRAFT